MSVIENRPDFKSKNYLCYLKSSAIYSDTINGGLAVGSLRCLYMAGVRKKEEIEGSKNDQTDNFVEKEAHYH